MPDLDATARHALKLRPPEPIRWLLPRLDVDLAYRRWLDTEMIAFPGEPKRRCDTVAELVSRSGTQAPWALVLEVESRPRATIRERLLEYEARVLRRKRHGPRRRDRYRVAGLLLLLTGTMKQLEVNDALPGTDLLLHFRASVVNLSGMSAAEALERIGKGELGRTILCWAPLMKDGGEPGVIARWVELARDEPDAQLRADYAGLAKVFAEATGRLEAWDKALEGWDMWQSQVIKGWRDQGALEDRRESIVQLLRARFSVELPADLVRQISQTTDLATLKRWFDAAITAPSLEAFGATLKATSAAPVNGTASAP
jgi:hypothetical protein